MPVLPGGNLVNLPAAFCEPAFSFWIGSDPCAGFELLNASSPTWPEHELQEGVAIAFVLLGLGAFNVVHRPSFWNEFGSRLGKALLPLAWCCVPKSLSPDGEDEWREAERRGRGMSG